MKNKMGFKILIMAVAVVAAGIFLCTLEYYTSESYMTLNGEPEITIGLNGMYDDLGATAVLHGQDASGEIVTTGQVDTTTPGTYTVTYSAGNFTVDRTVTVLTEMDPVLTLKGDTTQTIKLGDEYTEPGYSASDSSGNDLTASVVVRNDTLNRAGPQQVEYTVTDASGKSTRVYRTVNVEPNTEDKTSGLPICMFHYVYDENNIPANVNANWISIEDLSEELEWLKSEDFYFPTWQEVSDYLEGKLLLPPKSVVLTFDDCTYEFLNNGIPVLEKYQVPATSFVITKNSGAKKVAEYQSPYITFESHSDGLHTGGGNIGHGGIFSALSDEAILADLKKSIDIVGRSDVFAYPYGDYNDHFEELVEQAGFKCALTTRQGRAKPGDDPFRLPRQRMARNQSMEAFRAMVLPY